MTITTLNEQFGHSKQIEFSTTKGNLPIVTLTGQHSTAMISLYGAQVLSYIPTGEEDILWMSDKSLFQEGKAIRGGIPICFPWFGPNPDDSKKPQHGFARLSTWSVKTTTVSPQNVVSITLQLQDSAETKTLWPFSFIAEIIVTIDTKLEVTLRCTNTDNRSFDYSDALHSYFNVKDIADITIDGLMGATYFPAGSETGIQQQEKSLSITKEENRRYLNHDANCVIHDKGYKRNIHVGKAGSKTTVVWNPGAETTKTMSDMLPEGYKTFICVEAANAFNNIIKLAPGERFELSTIIQSTTE
ncbi:MAG TPA: D-hexose-6-phosphate mutarotase [Ferruginibacter sp.]|jgi:glucose-6-phosphate 1-epimerase|nr:D-hexose-6-phosphate mutarotase [Ferruginibacter sp.]